MAAKKTDPTKKIKKIESSKERAARIEEAVKLTWESLTSHLPYCHSDSPEGEEFHKTCVKEYARLIVLLSELY